MRTPHILAALTLVLLAQLAAAAVPHRLSYQGLLKTGTGEILPDGNYTLDFAIYDVPSGGSPLWSESQLLTVTDGIFNAILGSVSAITLDFSNAYWLGVSIEGDPELAPRVELTAAAYALNADRLDGLDSADFSLTGHSHTLDALSDVNTAGAAEGEVLTYESGTWTAAVPATPNDDWLNNGDDVYRSIGSVGIGGAPYRPVLDTSKGGGDVQGRTPATTKLLVVGDNEGIFASMTETDAALDDRAAVYGYRTRFTANDGTGMGYGGSNAAVIGANYWGDHYTFGVAGYNYNDYGDCAGVFGGNWDGSYWGALGYKDFSGNTWGSYTPSNAYIGGTLTANGKIRNVGNFGNGYAGTALVAENTAASGIAVWAETWGNDATMVLDVNGTGDMLRGFLNGSLKFRVLNNGSVVTPVLQITGGADLAEPFALSEHEAEVEAGSLLVIDDRNAGKLRLSDREYDRCVAGVVSGAGGVNPGLTLSQQEVFDGGRNVALNGRVYALADAANGPIAPGDLLTTSSRPGYAMKATDLARSHGAVIGKAMSSLDEGTGLVLVLVNLQ